MSSLSHGFAEWYYVTPQWKGGLEIFLGVSSLSHGFARALPYSAMERRIEIFLIGSRPIIINIFLLIEIFLVGSRPTLGEYF